MGKKLPVAPRCTSAARPMVSAERCHDKRTTPSSSTRASSDGSFGQFQEAVLGLNVDFEGPAVRCTTLRGETLSFGWEGPLMVDGREQPITGFKHYDNPYCTVEWPASQMKIQIDNESLVLDFAQAWKPVGGAK